MTLLKNKFSSLNIREIKLNLHLGWSAEERVQRQTILIDVLLKFPTPPLACLNDELADTYSYDPLINEIIAEAESREFRLIEHVAATIYQFIRKSIPESVAMNIIVYKNLAVVNLPGAAVFQFGDFEV